MPVVVAIAVEAGRGKQLDAVHRRGGEDEEGDEQRQRLPGRLARHAQHDDQQRRQGQRQHDPLHDQQGVAVGKQPDAPAVEQVAQPADGREIVRVRDLPEREAMRAVEIDAEVPVVRADGQAQRQRQEQDDHRDEGGGPEQGRAGQR